MSAAQFSLQTALQESAGRFLAQFEAQKRANGLVYLHPCASLQALFDLDCTPALRRQAIGGLRASDCRQAPASGCPGSACWVFATRLKGRNILITLAIGEPAGPALCLSFGLAESRSVPLNSLFYAQTQAAASLQPSRP